MPPADDVTRVTLALRAGVLCATCIARTTSVPLVRVRAFIERATELFATTQAVRRCEGCLQVTGIVRVGRGLAEDDT